MRNLVCAAALFSIALLGAGCKSGPSLVGKWTGTFPIPSGQSVPATFEFKADDKVVLTVTQGGPSVAMSGDYKVEKDELTMTLKDVKITGLPPQFAARAKGAEEQAKKLFASQGAMKSKIKFASDDEVTITGSDAKGGSSTLTRVKEKS